MGSRWVVVRGWGWSDVEEALMSMGFPLGMMTLSWN